MTLALVVRFAVSALVGVSIAVGAAAVTSTPQLVSTAGAGPLVPLTAESGIPLAVELAPAQPVPLEPAPPTATVTLTTFHAPVPSGEPGGEPGGGVESAWLKPSVPRVPAITQFDGGPLQSVNCLMASGAMLARLGYGIRTTGSQLRALQDDQEGGTNHTNLQNAVRKGWNVQFRSGALTPLQLRALLYAGAGAVVGGIYGELPVSIRLQTGFTGSHSIYIDAFRPPGPDGPAAYYVMDPIGKTWQGYRGSWWPADVVERFATALLGGRIYTMWAFPGGVAPVDHPILPRDAYPGPGGATPSDEPRSSPSAPDASPSSSPDVDPLPTGDPMPMGDLPIVGDPTIGDPPDDKPRFPDFRFETNLFEMIEPDRRTCLGRPQPAGCPQGIPGIVDLGDRSSAYPTGPPGKPIEIRYAGAIAPDTYEVIFEPPPDTSPSMWFWSRAGGALIPATIETGMLDGRTVAVATVTLEPGADYSFVAAATGDGIRAMSTVGGLSVEADR